MGGNPGNQGKKAIKHLSPAHAVMIQGAGNSSLDHAVATNKAAATRQIVERKRVMKRFLQTAAIHPGARRLKRKIPTMMNRRGMNEGGQ